MPETLGELALLLAAGLAGGAVNAVVGGGTFFTFPALLAAGLPPVTANATNAVAIWPGHAGAILAYLPELRSVHTRRFARAAAAFAGGLLGAALLVRSGDVVFYHLVPWLLALGTLLFAASTWLRETLQVRAGGRAHPGAALAAEFGFAVYGGYFGAGLGVLLMASLTLTGHRDAQMANAQKNLLATIIKSSAVLFFIVAGLVHWPAALAVLGGSAVGGYAGGRLARRVPAGWLRAVVIAVGAALSLRYFAAVYLG